jgi:hypothetical protein
LIISPGFPWLTNCALAVDLAGSAWFIDGDTIAAGALSGPALTAVKAGAVTAVEGQPGNTVAVDILTPGQFLASAARARFGNLHHLHRRDFSDIGVHPGKARTAVIQDDRAVATSLSNLDRGGPGTSFGATKLALLRSLKELPL